MKTFALVHNIPSPYRLHLFRVMCERLKAREVAFHVHFMAQTHADRPHWVPAASDLGFDHTFWRDVGPTISGVKWHLNPGLVLSLRGSPPDYFMVGGLWDSLTTPLVSVLAPRQIGIGWFEGNTSAVGRVHGPIGVVKKALCARYQYLAVPGSEGEKYANIFLDGAPKTKVLTLPNIVDERRFLPRWQLPEDVWKGARNELGVASDDLVALWPARLVPVKGVLEFLSIIDRGLLRGWKVVILGQGPLEVEIQKLIQSKGLDSQVFVRPYLAYEKMPCVYAAADLFLLPSLYDPNPLSVVEALHSGLPILVSSSIGNYPEACYPERNGWGLNPLDKTSVLQATERALSSSVDKLRAMGRESERIAKDFWGSTNAVERFLAPILGSRTG